MFKISFGILIQFSIIITQLDGFTINRVILASDANPDYIQFWPIVAKVWQSFGFRPTLALIARKNVKIDESLGDVIRFEPIPDIPTSEQAQVIRLFLPTLFPDDISIVSDIDLIPVNKEYYVQSVVPIADDCFVVFRDYFDPEFENRFPLFFIAASGKVFSDVFHIYTIDDMRTTIIEWHKKGYGRSTDERMLRSCLEAWPYYQTKCIRLMHSSGCGEANRYRFVWNRKKLKEGFYKYVDVPRPYQKYKTVIHQFLNEAGFNFAIPRNN